MIETNGLLIFAAVLLCTAVALLVFAWSILRAAYLMQGMPEVMNKTLQAGLFEVRQEVQKAQAYCYTAHASEKAVTDALNEIRRHLPPEGR